MQLIGRSHIFRSLVIEWWRNFIPSTGSFRSSRLSLGLISLLFHRIHRPAIRLHPLASPTSAPFSGSCGHLQQFGSSVKLFPPPLHARAKSPCSSFWCLAFPHFDLVEIQQSKASGIRELIRGRERGKQVSAFTYAATTLADLLPCLSFWCTTFSRFFFGDYERNHLELGDILRRRGRERGVGEDQLVHVLPHTINPHTHTWFFAEFDSRSAALISRWFLFCPSMGQNHRLTSGEQSVTVLLVSNLVTQIYSDSISFFDKFLSWATWSWESRFSERSSRKVSQAYPSFLM